MFQNYHAVAEAVQRGFVLQEMIEDLGHFLQPLANRDGLVFIPRLMRGQGLSFRYCGLEVLQYRAAGFFRMIQVNPNGQISGLNGGVACALDTQLTNQLSAVRNVVEPWLDAGVVGNVHASPIRGFHPEHWLEGLVVSDTVVGEQSRPALMLPALQAVSTQVPVNLLQPRRRLNIDVVGAQALFTIVELKVDNAWAKAQRELLVYTDWALGIQDRNTFDAQFTPQALETEGVLPAHVNPITPGAIRAVAVIRSDRDDLHGVLANGTPVWVMRLPADWLACARDGQGLFPQPLYQ